MSQHIEWTGPWFTVHRRTSRIVRRVLVIAVAIVVTVMVWVLFFVVSATISISMRLGIIFYLGPFTSIALGYLIYRGLMGGPAVPTGKLCPKCSNELQFKEMNGKIKRPKIECPACLTEWPVIKRDDIVRNIMRRQKAEPEIVEYEIKEIKSTAPPNGYCVSRYTSKDEYLPLWSARPLPEPVSEDNDFLCAHGKGGKELCPECDRKVEDE